MNNSGNNQKKDNTTSSNNKLDIFDKNISVDNSQEETSFVQAIINFLCIVIFLLIFGLILFKSSLTNNFFANPIEDDTSSEEELSEDDENESSSRNTKSSNKSSEKGNNDKSSTSDKSVNKKSNSKSSTSSKASNSKSSNKKSNSKSSTSSNSTTSTENGNGNSNTNSQSNGTSSNNNQSSSNINIGTDYVVSRALSEGNGTISLNKLKSILNSVIGAEGSNYIVSDNGSYFMINLLNKNDITVVDKNGNKQSYVTPEMYGAKGDGVTDDTNAIKKCMESNVKNVVLSKKYKIRSSLSSSYTKNIYSGQIIYDLSQNRGLVFTNSVVFCDTRFTSSIKTTGTSPHSQTYQSTSNIDFVEVWGNDSKFINCSFENALRAIRGRISTGATKVPDNLYVNNSTFIDCKAPIQGYFANATINNSKFKNNGDLYDGDHSIYIESYGSKVLNVTGCTVEIYGSESGAAFQIYGKKSDQSTIPQINISNCTVKSNGVVSSDYANVSLANNTYVAQHGQRYVARVENGRVDINGGSYSHSYFISSFTNVPVVAKNSTFTLVKSFNAGRTYFPSESSNCKFINWGGTVLYNNTTVNNSTFTRNDSHVVGNYYIGIASGKTITINNSTFKRGDNISYNATGTINLNNSDFVD